MMREIILLLPILLKGPGGYPKLKVGTSRILNVILPLVLIMALAPMLIGIGGFNMALYITSQALGDPRIVLDFACLTASVVVFFFGFFSVISYFYLSSDSEIYMSLPLRPASIAVAKLIVLAIWEYIFLLFILAPALGVYGYFEGLSLLWWLEASAIFILFPFGPLAVAGIIALLLMRVTSISPYRDKLRIIGGGILLLSTIFLQYILQNTGEIAKNPGSLQPLLDGGKSKAILYLLFPARVSAADTLAWSNGNGILALISFIIITLGLTAGFAFLASKLYYPGLYYNGGKGHGEKKSTSLTRTRPVSYRQSGAFSAFLWREIRLLFRSPITFLNNVLMNFIWPLFLIVPVLFAGSKEMAIDDLTRLLPQRYGIVFAAVIVCLIIFASSTNGIGATSISREGQQLNYLKTMPIPAATLLLAKLTAGSYLSLVAAASLYLIIALIGLPLPLIAATVIPGVLAAILPQLIGLLLDLSYPYLNWDNEVKAVKHNMNVLYTMGLSMLLIAILGTAAFVLQKLGASLWTWAAIFSLTLGGLYLLLLRILVKKAETRLARITP